MNRENEHKFLVSDGWKLAYSKNPESYDYTITQGYITRDPDIRVRIDEDSAHNDIQKKKSYLIIKSPRVGSSRDEYIYDIPIYDAVKMICELASGSIIKKHRYVIPFTTPDAYDLKWEVDVFKEPIRMTLCEIEIPDGCDFNSISLPDWIIKDVTDDPSMYNNSISERY